MVRGFPPHRMAEKPQRTQIVAGIFVLCGIVLLGGLILEFGPLRHWMRKPYTVYATFADAQNIIKGSPVRRAGSQIGKVSSSPELLPDLKGVKVSLDIYPEFQIPQGSHLRISSIGLMGDAAVDVVPPPLDKGTGNFVKAGDTMEGTSGADLSSVATKVTDEATEVMKDIRAGIAELNKTIERIQTGVLSDDNLRNVSSSLKQLNESLEKFDRTILSEENTTAIRDSLALLKTTMQNSSSASAKADSALAKMDKAVDQLGPGLKGFSGATASLDNAADALEALLKEARSGRGVLYTLFNNVELRDNVERLVANMRRHGPVFYKDKAPSTLPPPAPPPTRRAPQPSGRKR
jgi:phospholipid/cholesterol/gamma-HCH transport system substrate-binding protein